MTTQLPSPVSIRPPVLIRGYVAAFTVCWIGGVVWTTMIHHRGTSIAVGVLFIAFGTALAYRLLRLGVHADPDGTLTIRNNLSTRRLSRDQIEEFRLGSNGGNRIGQRTVQVLLRDKTAYGLDVCRAPLGLGTRKLTRQVDLLNAWLHARP